MTPDAGRARAGAAAAGGPVRRRDRSRRASARCSATANIITFDMGGTSTDVGLIVDGEALQRHETEAEQVPPARCRWSTSTRSAPAAARSRASRTAAPAASGRESAGADPGPACYGRGGTRPTVTDADLVLGHPRPGQLPRRADPARRRGGARGASRREVAEPLGLSVEEAAAGIEAHRRHAHGRPAAHGHDRARLRPARLRPARVRRRRRRRTHPRSRSRSSTPCSSRRASRCTRRSAQPRSDVSITAELAVADARCRGAAARRTPTAERVEQVFRELERRASDGLAAQGVPEAARELQRARRGAVHAADEGAAGAVPRLGRGAARGLPRPLRAALRRRGRPRHGGVRARHLRRRRDRAAAAAAAGAPRARDRRAARRRPPAAPTTPRRAPSPTRRSTTASSCAPATASKAPRSSSTRARPSRSSPGRRRPWTSS